MIKSKQDYEHYLRADKIALEIDDNGFQQKLKLAILPPPVWSFQKKLRKLEYYYNCKRGVFNKIYTYWLRYQFRKESIKLNFSIPVNVFGPGLAIVHYGTIIVNPRAKVGKNCRIHACVNIGASGGHEEAPQIGDNVYIGPGAKIYGNIAIGNRIAISANSCVSDSFHEESIMLAGMPAKKIKEIDINRLIKHAEQIEKRPFP